MAEKMTVAEEEKALLIALSHLEDLAEKKTRIYSRLLTEVSLAKAMEELSLRHEKRKEKWVALATGKVNKKQNEQGMSATNGQEEEK